MFSLESQMSHTDNLGVIDTVVLEEVFKNPAGTIVYDETITIPPI